MYFVIDRKNVAIVGYVVRTKELLVIELIAYTRALNLVFKLRSICPIYILLQV